MTNTSIQHINYCNFLEKQFFTKQKINKKKRLKSIQSIFISLALNKQ